MRRVRLLLCLIGITLSLSSCWQQHYRFFEDDEWSMDEYNDDRAIINGEIDLDDMDR